MPRRTLSVKPKAAVLHGAVPPDAPLDEQDVLQEAEGVVAALENLGFTTTTVPLDLNLGKAGKALRKLAPRFVFNLVESVNGNGQLIHFSPALLEYLGLPYTGAGLEAMFLTSNKILAKRQMALLDLPTPSWCTGEEALNGTPPLDFPCIVKNGWEHASIGVHEAGVAADPAALREIIRERLARGEKHLYCESYIDGREFNLACVGGAPGPEVLDPSEILFEDYPEGKLKIVDYKAKWDEESFEYGHTPRTFDFVESDGSLLGELKRITLACWRGFGLRGYARVDFRVDAAGRPLIMEVNANPCINPDASGFVSTAERAGLDYTALVARIIKDTDPRLLDIG
jgi:D-alanine-D-alanine ligase